MDRTQAPPIQELSKIDIPEIDQARLDSGIQVFYSHDNSNEAFKIEVVHKGGFVNLDSASTSSLLCKLLLEGTREFQGKSFLEKIDSKGSFIESAPGFDNATVSLFGLKKYFSENVRLISSAIYEAELMADRLTVLKKKEVNRIKLNQEKGSYLTSINLRKNLFGDHPYGYVSDITQVEGIDLQKLIQARDSHVQSFDLFVSGDLPTDFLEILNEYFKSSTEFEFKSPVQDWPIDAISTNIKDDKFIQSSIRLGKRMFNRHHQDYAAFMLLNEILGGYFGSRLMKNIREDKGYTYGINSHLYVLKETGYFTIGTEVNGSAKEDTLHQIELEINRLKNELIGEEELLTVKNYMLGNFANSLSTPFAAIDKFKSLYTQGLNLSFYENYLEDLNTINSESLLKTANTYLNWDEMSVSSAGKA